jgi:hypothetical protein
MKNTRKNEKTMELFLHTECFLQKFAIVLLMGTINFITPIFASSTSYDDFHDVFFGENNFIHQYPMNVHIDIYDKKSRRLSSMSLEISSDMKVEELKDRVRYQLFFQLNNRKYFKLSKKEKKIIKKGFKKGGSLIVMKNHFLFPDNYYLYERISKTRYPSLNIYLAKL